MTFINFTFGKMLYLKISVILFPINIQPNLFTNVSRKDAKTRSKQVHGFHEFSLIKNNMTIY